MKDSIVLSYFFFLGMLLTYMQAKAETVAYWRFEEGPAGYALLHPVADGVYYESVTDNSGNGNELSVWNEDWGGYSYDTDLGFTIVNDLPNKFCIHNNGQSPSMWTSTDDPINSSSPSAFTIEATFKLENGDCRTIVGRDSYGTNSDAALSALYFQVLPDNAVAIKFCDVSGYWHQAVSGTGAIQTFDAASDPIGSNTPWYSMAGISDGSTLSLYLRNITGQGGWQLLVQTDLRESGSPNTALTVGAGDGTDWDAGNWSVGRGLRNGNYVDRALGFIDEIRISDTALDVSELLYCRPPGGNDWVGYIDSNLSISELSIPGTHDSGALYEPWPGTAICQDLSITEQLNAGIRFLDVRCRHIENTFTIHHGSVYQHMNFSDVLNSVFNFLNANPTECVLMSVKEEYDSEDITRSFEETFDSYVLQNPEKWYLNDTIPTLAQARGKIILLRRFSASGTPKGIPASNWSDNTTFTINNTNSQLRIQDYYKVPDAGSKWNTVGTFLAEALNGNLNSLYLNYTSGYVEGLFGIPDITEVSDGVNPQIVSYFSTSGKGRFGVLAMDFTDAQKASLIIGTNFTIPTAFETPVITSHPQSVLVFASEPSVTFSVSAMHPTGGGLSYQWYYSTDNANDTPSDDMELTGETAAILTISNPLNAADEGFYYCSVGNSGGDVLTNPAYLFIKDLINYWQFDGDLVDAANGYDAIYLHDSVDLNNPPFVVGKVGTGAIEFSGVQGVTATVGDDMYPGQGGEMTITAWVKAASRSAWASIVKSWDDQNGGLVHFGLDGTGYALDVYISQSNGVQLNLNEGVEFPVDAWQFVAVVADGTKLRLYRNGLEVKNVDYDGTLLHTFPYIGIGHKPTDAGGLGILGFWDGKIDDVKIYNYARTPEEIVDEYDLSVLFGIPVITSHPQSVLVFASESSVTFSVSATDLTGGGLSYQWYYSTDNANDTPSDDMELTGETAAILTISNPLNAADEGYYYCSVGNSCGDVLTNPAYLFIKDLINYWQFDGDLVDAANGYDAIYLHDSVDLNNPPFVAGKIGTGAIEFSGAQGVTATVGDDMYPGQGGEMTITAWVKAASRSAWASIVKSWDDQNGGLVHFGLDGTGYALDVYISQSNGVQLNLNEGVEFPVDAWQFVAVVADGTKLRLYRNGLEVKNVDYDGTLLHTFPYIGIGQKPTDAGGLGTLGFWDGQIDDVQIYNYARTPEEIVDEYGLPVCLYPAGSADVTGDCVVNLEDFAVIALNWLHNGCYPAGSACP